MKRWVELGLWVALSVGLVRAARAMTGEPELPSTELGLTAPFIPAPVEPATARAFQRDVTARNPFRLNRMPSNAGYGNPSADPGRVVRLISLPPIRLSGIVGGPPWRAVLDGVPGHRESVVAFNGAVFDNLTVSAVHRDSVTLALPDTTWVLGLAPGGRE